MAIRRIKHEELKETTRQIQCYYCTATAVSRDIFNRAECPTHLEQRKLTADKAWLLREGIVTEEMTTPERMKAMAVYRIRISREPPPDPLEWARRILRRFEDGEYILPIQERMAKEALGL